MQGSMEHFWALDVACSQGVDIEVNDKTWTFSPLRLRDMATLVARARSDALKAFYDAKRGRPANFKQDAIDLSTILFGQTAQMAFTDPAMWWLKVKLSLQRKHPRITDDEVDAMLDDEEMAAKLVEVITAITGGPVTPDDIPEERADGPANPTETTADGLP